MRLFNTFIFIIAFFLFMTPHLGLCADENLHVTSHYFIPDAKSVSKYKEAIKWPMANLSDWLKFRKSLENSKVESKSTPFVPDGKTEIIHIVKRNDDQITGADYYITPGHITEIVTTAVNSYSVTTPTFRDFLEKDLQNRFTFSDKADNVITVNTPGLIVMYNGSNRIQNPIWKISNPKELSNYIAYIKTSRRIRPDLELMEEKDPSYSGQDTFILFLNMPHAPARFVTVTTQGNIRVTRTIVTTKTYVDTLDIFSSFKSQAERLIDPEKFKLMDSAEKALDKTKSF